MKKHANVRAIDYSIYTLDENSCIESVDSKFESITGYSPSYIKRHKISQYDLIPEADVENYKKILYPMLEKTNEAYIEHRIKRKDGEIIYVFCLGYIENNKVKIRITRVDASLNFLFTEELYKNRLNDLELIANLDNLTGLLRRDPFIDSIDDLIDSDKHFALFILDIDDFKNINDTYGHMVGDDVLVKISKVFKKCVKSSGCVARLGGDEFAILYKYKEEKDIMAMADKIVSKIEKEKVDRKVTATISVGITTSNGKNNFEEMYQKADEALYESKNNGKNRYTIKD